MGTFTQPKSRNFHNGDKCFGNFFGKFPESPKIVKLLKHEQF